MHYTLGNARKLVSRLTSGAWPREATKAARARAYFSPLGDRLASPPILPYRLLRLSPCLQGRQLRTGPKNTSVLDEKLLNDD